ncbi:hypothetical protein [Streptomyces sp. HUAS ZL42]|uniref:hypothetical protein n=1 Tax=Streptomyces sp. HUAS ZL42 TaxID=3231715 RepID=UPI00345EBFEA
MGEDPSIGTVLFGFLLAGGTATVMAAAVVLPAVGLGIWLKFRWQRGRSAPPES